tara:strand:- start:641 stop:949 length:309 start_codon:yes stop_codon:yes gene_type:complete
MPALAGAIGAIIVGLISFFAKWMTKRLAAVAAAVVALLAVVGSFVGIVEGLIAGISYTAPDFSGIFLLLPANFSTCISVIVAARLAYWVYAWNVAIIQMKLF